MKISFQMKLFISLSMIFSVVFLSLSVCHYVEYSNKIYQEVGTRARVQSEMISVIPGLRNAIMRKDVEGISTIMRDLSLRSDSGFIVIGDKEMNHLFHSATDNKIGTPLIGGDNREVLQGKTVITLRRGGLGVSLRSKSPVYDNDNKVIGIVSVGYMKSYLDQLTLGGFINGFILFSFIFAGLFLFSWFFSRSIKRQMFSLEPREIGLLVYQQQAMMESIYEGVIAIDDKRNIILLNKAAQNLLRLKIPPDELKGKPLSRIVLAVPFFDIKIMQARDTHDEISSFNHRTVIASRIRIKQEGVLQGWVITFRDRQEIDKISARLSQVKCYLDNLRIMHHEQLNKTTVISGLLQLGRYSEAIDYIQIQSEHAQGILDFIVNKFISPALCGLLLGKISLAREKGVDLVFDPTTQLLIDFPAITEYELISIVGNLLDNAIEATRQCSCPRSPIEVLIVGSTDELVIEIADKGAGIPETIKDCLFERGVSTKEGSDHGIGLSLVRSFVSRASGYIEVTDNFPGGTIFSVFIPAAGRLTRQGDNIL